MGCPKQKARKHMGQNRDKKIKSAHPIQLFFCFILNGSNVLHGKTVPAVNPTEYLSKRYAEHFVM
jgi:hypothetical protein